jgi:hypothetical protein
MQTTTKMILVIFCIGAVAVETLTPVYAQHRHRTWNGCPRVDGTGREMRAVQIWWWPLLAWW